MSILEPKLDVLVAKRQGEAKSKKMQKIVSFSKAKSVLQISNPILPMAFLFNFQHFGVH